MDSVAVVICRTDSINISLEHSISNAFSFDFLTSLTYYRQVNSQPFSAIRSCGIKL